MDTKILAQVREQAAELESLKAELGQTQQERDELNRQLVTVRQQNERLRNQQQRAGQIEDRLQRIEGSIENFKKDVENKLIDEFIRDVAPHLKVTNMDVANLERRQNELKDDLAASYDKFDERLNGFEGWTAGTAGNITKLFVDQVNAGWSIVQEKYTKAEAALKKVHTLNKGTLDEQRASVDELKGAVEKYGKQSADTYGGLVTVQRNCQQTAAKVDAAVATLEGLTSGALTELAETAKQTIIDTQATAERELQQSRAQANRVMAGLDTKMAKHPYLTIMVWTTAMVFVAVLIGAVVGGFGVARSTGVMIAAAMDPVTQKLEAKTREIDDQTEALSTTFDHAQMWQALMESQTGEQRQATIKRVQEQLQRQGRKMPKSLAAKAQTVSISEAK